jgi:hypothetical protein
VGLPLLPCCLLVEARVAVRPGAAAAAAGAATMSNG